jgi:cytochrome P450
MRGCSDRFGDRFTVSLSQNLPPVVFFSNPQALQVIMTSDDSELFDSPGDLNTLLEPLLGTQSLMGLSGDRHRRMRQLLMPPFHGQLIRDITEEVMRERVAWKTFPVRKSMQKISLRRHPASSLWFKRGHPLSATREAFGNDAR